MKMGYQVIHSKALMQYLVKKGFELIKVDDSKKNPNMKVFLFYKSEELSNAIQSYKQGSDEMSNKNQTNLEVGQVFKNYQAIC